MNPSTIVLLRLEHFLILKDEQNQESWISFVRHMLATILYTLHKDFRYVISNNTLKTDQPQINFYLQDIITYIKKHHIILNTQRNSKTIY